MFGPADVTATHTLSIYIPNKTRHGKDIPAPFYWINEVRLMFTLHFGGCTAHTTKGMWYNKQSGRFIDERTVVVSAKVTEESLHGALEPIRHFIQDFIRFCEQNAVAIAYDDMMYFVHEQTAATKPAHPRLIGEEISPRAGDDGPPRRASGT
jgi:hypothetical protein